MTTSPSVSLLFEQFTMADEARSIFLTYSSICEISRSLACPKYISSSTVIEQNIQNILQNTFIDILMNNFPKCMSAGFSY